MSKYAEMLEHAIEAEGVKGVMIRPGFSTDVPFITSTWLNSMYNAFRFIRKDTFMHFQHKVIEELVPRSDVRVLCNEKDPDHILGYVVAEAVSGAVVVHYLYVKQSMRGNGLANALMTDLSKRYLNEQGLERELPVVYTARTRAFWADADGHAHKNLHELARARGYTYNPFILWAMMPGGWAK